MAHKLEKFGVHPECMVERKNTQVLHITVEIVVMFPNLDFTAPVLFLIPVVSRTSFKLHTFHGNICVRRVLPAEIFQGFGTEQSPVPPLTDPCPLR